MSTTTTATKTVAKTATKTDSKKTNGRVYTYVEPKVKKWLTDQVKAAQKNGERTASVSKLVSAAIQEKYNRAKSAVNRKTKTVKAA